MPRGVKPRLSPLGQAPCARSIVPGPIWPAPIGPWPTGPMGQWGEAPLFAGIQNYLFHQCMGNVAPFVSNQLLFAAHARQNGSAKRNLPQAYLYQTLGFHFTGRLHQQKPKIVCLQPPGFLDLY